MSDLPILSVNVGAPACLLGAPRPLASAIFKQPVSGRVWLGPEGFDGDLQVDRQNHGGTEKAVYALGTTAYAHWLPRLNLDPATTPWGLFGETVTVDGLDDRTICLGDTLRLGAAVVVVTQPRSPCFKLALKLGQPSDFPKRFWQAGQIGCYLRVREPGEVTAGTVLTVLDRDANAVSVAKVTRLRFGTLDDPILLERALKIAALAKPSGQTSSDHLNM